ncbi:MAG TPA: AraC family transcriptional regulator [Tahibacter sp.]|nr:AraC family transcriptional regulator [Tahibacter sp.]
MTDFAVQKLLDTPTVAVRDVCCAGRCKARGAEECASATQLVFPYRGVYVRHVDADAAVAEASQMLCFNAGDGYRISHPVTGGDACLSLTVDEALLREMTPASLLRAGPEFAFREQRLAIDPRAQALVALVRHGLVRGVAEPLEAESLALTLVQRALGPRTTRARGASASMRKLVDRAKLVLAGDLARRWTLDAIAAEVGGSPVYLTQAFGKVEGVPLYRYHLRLRLARALDRLADADDLTTLALDLGFSSHSHFSAAFQSTYGRTPSAFREAIGH